MNSINFLLEIQHQMNEAFVSQDPELLDVVFEIEGKKLYADKLRLSVVSPTFKSMLSDRWNAKNEAIKIKEYKFEDFKEFLTSIYSGECNFNDQNIITLLDLAEFYQIKYLKELCDEYLAKIQCNLLNVFELMELSNKYSMIKMKKSLRAFIGHNFDAFVNSDKFREISKDVIQELVGFGSTGFVSSEKVFQAIYEWAEHQAKKKQEQSSDRSFNRNDTIKAILSDSLPYIQFEKMKQDFLIGYVVKRCFLFDYDELSDTLANASPGNKVRIANSSGQSIISGALPENSHVIKFIEFLKNRHYNNSESSHLVYWTTKCQMPINPSSLQKRDGDKWYLFHFSTSEIGVARVCDILDSYYLLAEMTDEASGFQITARCKIEIE